MKNISSLIIGIFIILFSNSILNFLPTEIKIEPILIYIIILSIYSKQNKYFLYFLSVFLGFLQDSVASMYSGVYVILFMIIMLVGISIKNQIRKDYFITTFLLCLFFVLGSSIYQGVIFRNIDITKNLYYIAKTMFFISIIIIIMNIVIKKLEK